VGIKLVGDEDEGWASESGDIWGVTRNVKGYGLKECSGARRVGKEGERVSCREGEEKEERRTNGVLVEERRDSRGRGRWGGGEKIIKGALNRGEEVLRGLQRGEDRVEVKPECKMREGWRAIQNEGEGTSAVEGRGDGIVRGGGGKLLER